MGGFITLRVGGREVGVAAPPRSAVKNGCRIVMLSAREHPYVREASQTPMVCS